MPSNFPICSVICVLEIMVSEVQGEHMVCSLNAVTHGCVTNPIQFTLQSPAIVIVFRLTKPRSVAFFCRPNCLTSCFRIFPLLKTSFRTNIDRDHNLLPVRLLSIQVNINLKLKKNKTKLLGTHDRKYILLVEKTIPHKCIF